MRRNERHGGRDLSQCTQPKTSVFDAYCRVVDAINEYRERFREVDITRQPSRPCAERQLGWKTRVVSRLEGCGGGWFIVTCLPKTNNLTHAVFR